MSGRVTSSAPVFSGGHDWSWIALRDLSALPVSLECERDVMKTEETIELSTTVAARIAGEDIACGDFVAALDEILELPSWFWSCSGVTLPPDEPVRIRFVTEDAGLPYKVIGVCLPFVYAKSYVGSVVVLDTRQRQLVRLDPGCAQIVWDKMKGPSKKKRK